MRKSTIIMGLFLFFIMLSGCTHPVYKHVITGVDISPEQVVVNEPVAIWLKLTDLRKDAGIDVQYVWTIEGFEEPFVTDRSYLTVTFDSPGTKNCRVTSVTADKDYITNEYTFTIDVK